jgi:hypothetical protein
MKFKGTVKRFRLAVPLALAVLLCIGLVNSANAGRMKDIHFMHLEALAIHLFGHPDTDGLETRKTAFAKPEPGYFTAVESEVLVYSQVRNDFEWVKCTTMISRTESGTVEGTPSYDYSVAKTVCN